MSTTDTHTHTNTVCDPSHLMNLSEPNVCQRSRKTVWGGVERAKASWHWVSSTQTLHSNTFNDQPPARREQTTAEWRFNDEDDVTRVGLRQRLWSNQRLKVRRINQPLNQISIDPPGSHRTSCPGDVHTTHGPTPHSLFIDGSITKSVLCNLSNRSLSGDCSTTVD